MPQNTTVLPLPNPCQSCGANEWRKQRLGDKKLQFVCTTENCDTVRTAGHGHTPPVEHYEVIAVGSPKLSKDDLITTLENISETLDANLKINPSWQHPAWQEGDPCPNCGNETVNTLTVQDELYTSSEGEYNFQKHGDHTAGAGHIICHHCEEPLRQEIQPVPI